MKRKGTVLMTVLVVLSIVFIFGSTLIMYANKDIFNNIKNQDSMNALYLAQSGLIYAYYNLSNFEINTSNPIFTDNAAKKLDNGAFTVEAALNQDNSINIVSTGICGKSKKIIYAKFSPSDEEYSLEWYY